MKAWYSPSFDWKTHQLAIGEIPSEPLIALMELMRGKQSSGSLSIRALLSVSSVKISGKRFPPARAACPGGNKQPGELPAELIALSTSCFWLFAVPELVARPAPPDQLLHFPLP